MAKITYASDPVAARLSTTKPESPSAGLDPERLTEKVSSTTCQIFSPPDKNGKVGRAYKGSCPITWAWKEGKPVLRFCSGKGKPGRIIPVDDAVDAMDKAGKLCATWREKRGRVERDAKGLSPEFRIVAQEMSDSLTEYTLGRAPRRRRKR